MMRQSNKNLSGIASTRIELALAAWRAAVLTIILKDLDFYISMGLFWVEFLAKKFLWLEAVASRPAGPSLLGPVFSNPRFEEMNPDRSGFTRAVIHWMITASENHNLLWFFLGALAPKTSTGGELQLLTDFDSVLRQNFSPWRVNRLRR